MKLTARLKDAPRISSTWRRRFITPACPIAGNNGSTSLHAPCSQALHSLRAPPSSAHPAARFLDLSTRVFVDCTNLHRNPAFWKDLKCISSFLPSTAVVKTFTVWWSYIYFLFHLLFGKQNLYFLPVVNKCPLRLVFHPSCELTIVSGCVSVIITMACAFFFTSLCWSM